MSLIAEWPWLIPSIAFGIGLVTLMIRYPKVWLGVFMLSMPFFLTDSGVGVSATEVVFGTTFTLAIILWMMWRLNDQSRPLIKSWADFLLILFILAAMANILIALQNNVEPFGWGIDWSYFLLMLYYFPLREEFGRDEETFRQFLTLIALTSIAIALYSAYIFRTRMAENMVYAFQIAQARSVVLGPLILLAICIGIVMVFNVHRKMKLVTLFVVLVNAGALVLTYTRTLWVLLFLCIGMIMYFLTVRQNMRLLLTISVAVISTVCILFVMSPRLTLLGLKFMTNRITTSSQLSGGDRSFETRLIEAGEAWRHIKEEPLGGNGLRSKFISWQSIEQWHHDSSFVHVGYVGLIYRLGIPTALIMFAVLLGFSFRSFKTAMRARHPSTPPLVKALAVGVFVFIPALYVNIFMAGIFDQRYGNVMFAFIFAFVAITEEFVRRAQEATSMQQ